MLRIVILVVAAVVAGGCGYKGPLYMPSQKPAAKQPAKPPAEPVAPRSEQQ